MITGVRVQHHCYVQLQDANESPLDLEETISVQRRKKRVTGGEMVDGM